MLLENADTVRTRKKKNRVKLSFNAAHGAQDKTRTCTNAIVHYPLKVACLPISPPGHHTPRISSGRANIDTILRFAKFFPEKLRFFPDSELPGRERPRRDPGRNRKNRPFREIRGPPPGPSAFPGLLPKRGASPPSEIRPVLPLRPPAAEPYLIRISLSRYPAPPIRSTTKST